MTVTEPDNQPRTAPEELVSLARADTRVSGAALTGSAALGREDRWSDIDLALCVAVEADSAQVTPTGPTGCTTTVMPSITST